ncbi:AAA family ATPase [Pseudomonas mosselii]|uniref:AAA family ATPase n=1 Tax=Pseudomonas putida group TaxID=136845 RepID=UPI0016449CA6|nr:MULTISPECIES: AAA family ATPase [Pseudomonas putida group]MBC3450152.1 AAA family ATPase [Pseudomonas mosselii]MEC4024994.1 AAA family ATPase [Pseudomonas fulva]
MHILSISVEKLFGRFDYKIDLTPATGIAILTAPNGYGKSTILKILQSFASGDYYYFIREKFDSISISFSDGTSLDITRSEEDIKKQQVTIKCGRNSTKVRDPFEDNGDDTSYFIDRALPFLTRVGPKSWKHDRSGEILDRLEILSRYGSHPSLKRRLRKEDWLEQIRASLRIYSIPTNRLKVGDASHSASESSALMVGSIAKEIADRIQVAIRTQFEIGRIKETSFPTRLIESLTKGEVPTKESIVDSIDSVQEYESRFARLGLLPQASTTKQLSYHVQLSDPATLVVLKTYLDDIREKFSKLNDLAEKLDVFTGSINELFAFTSAEPSPDTGIIIRAKDGEKEELPLSLLSSGEQHLIVLIGKLVFNTEPGSMVLIDEPEISFHPEWQEKFLEILERIRSVSNFTAIIATHSPIMIGDRWEDTIELAELYNNYS